MKKQKNNGCSTTKVAFKKKGKSKCCEKFKKKGKNCKSCPMLKFN